MSCPNCGSKSYDQSVKKPECQQCGFTKPEVRELEAMDLLYCSGCGCHLMTAECIHPSNMKTVVKHKVVEKKEQ